MGRKKGTFSHGGLGGMDFYGFEDLLLKIQAAEGNVMEAVMDAMHEGAKPIQGDLLRFMAKHRQTGVTEASMTEATHQFNSGMSLYYEMGFDIKKGGLPALFLDIGTPKIAPSFFVYYAFKENTDNVKMLQEKALKKALKGLM